MHRCVVCSRSNDAQSLEEMLSKMIVVAAQRSGAQRGNVIAFLPGIQEIILTQGMLLKSEPKLTTYILHCDVLDTEDEVDLQLDDDSSSFVVYLATTVAAR